uniref:Phospholipid-transporting ATPase n=1 Tax=Trichuris muris TaxID=70415 RepID=A0A5S6QEL8_TRIMR
MFANGKGKWQPANFENIPLIAFDSSNMETPEPAELDLSLQSLISRKDKKRPWLCNFPFNFLNMVRYCCCPPREMTSRRVVFPCNDAASRYPPNVVRNQKHSAIFFLPAVLIEQFRFFLNLFFLIMALSQFLPQLRIGYLSTYWGPLCFVLTITICREAYDDFKRYIRDKEINSALYEVVTPVGSKIFKSSSIQVGDILKIHKNQRVPADAILLHTSDKVGTCFVRTDQLDGETDWKLKISCPLTQQVENELALFDMQIEIFAEKPQKNIHVFFGTLRSADQHGGQEEALNVDNILWRDTVLAAGSAVCAVVYTGCETRAALNTSQPRSKVGLFDREVNNLTKILFVLAFLLALVMVGLKGFTGIWPVTFFRFLLLFSYVIPLSLRVNLDMAKIVYSWLISEDKEIPGTVVRSSTIPEELGRIQYLLCDKTGTLTQNNMIFKKLHLGTVMFNQETFDEISSQLRHGFDPKSEVTSTQSLAVKVRLALEALVLCNNVTPAQDEGSETGDSQRTTTYQASSPDEVALVSWACDVGLELLYRDLNTIIIKDPFNRDHSYNILQIFPFTSERKRMGIIVQKVGTDEITFFVKGADVVLQPMVSYNDWLEEECANLAREGLRTLVVAKKMLTVQQYEAFSTSYNKAKLSLYDRQRKVNEVVSTLENDLQLLCLTGVEDQLQVDVRITLELLKNAGVKVWMLTGDKVETAFCIAKSSGLISRSHNVFQCPTVHTPREALQELEKLRACSSSLLVISSASLEFYLAYLPEEFINTSSACAAVVCCRCSPEQKAEVVRALKKYNGRKLVAAVGDGGNDVSMIQAADVGIGIVGKEGRHASLAADFSITQFSSLARLLLWHGRLCYRRSCSLSQFVIHRGLIVSTMQAVFSCIFYFASVSLYPGMLMVLYSTIYTMFPVFSLVMDRDAKEKVVLTFPDLYKDLVKGRSLSLKTFLIWFLISMYQGAVIMYGGIFLFESDFIHIVSISFTSLVITELIMVALTIHTWHWSMVAAEGLSLSIYVLSLLFLPNVFDLKYVRTWSFMWKTLVLTTITQLTTAGNSPVIFQCFVPLTLSCEHGYYPCVTVENFVR